MNCRSLSRNKEKIPVQHPDSRVIRGLFVFSLMLTAFSRPSVLSAEDVVKELRVGIIGLDTSHATAFTKILNDDQAAPDVAKCRVVAAYPKGSPDIVGSTSRVPGYTKDVQALGVEIVESIDILLTKVDVVLLETNDGRPHLEQVLPVFKAGKPVFIDKPIAGSLTDAVAIFEASRKYKVPVFSSSSLRYARNAIALRGGSSGKVLGCDAYSPCSLEETHPDLYWYGIHGVETLYTLMGPGCEKVSRASTPDFDMAMGVWNDGRLGTFRGLRKSGGYGGTAFTEKGIVQIGGYDGYRPLLVEIVKFFRTGVAPVSEAETLEIYTFMEAADESKRQGGCPVSLASVLKKARTEAAAKLK
jgi:predicted dehydrogenase